MFLGLRSLISVVPDLEAAKKWYSEVLGFGPYFDMPFYVGFNVGGYELGLRPQDDGEAASRGTAVCCYWGVADIRASFERLKSLGAVPVGEVMNVGGEIEVAEFNDPWGNHFGIIYNPEFQLPA